MISQRGYTPFFSQRRVYVPTLSWPGVIFFQEYVISSPFSGTSFPPIALYRLRTLVESTVLMDLQKKVNVILYHRSFALID